MEREAGHGAATVEKAVDVLFHLHDTRRACGVSEIGRALGLPKSTAHRLLAALRGRRLVDRDAAGRYRPGIALVALGLGVLSSEPLLAAARPVLEAEAAAGGETIFLAGARGGRLLVLDKEEGSSFLRASPRVGEEVPAAETAVGKLYLALAPERLAGGPGASASLSQPLAQVRARGWASNRDEWITGLTGVAAPILLDGDLVGAVAIAGPSGRIQIDPESAFVRRVCGAAERIGARLAGEVTQEGA